MHRNFRLGIPKMNFFYDLLSDPNNFVCQQSKSFRDKNKFVIKQEKTQVSCGLEVLFCSKPYLRKGSLKFKSFHQLGFFSRQLSSIIK